MIPSKSNSEGAPLKLVVTKQCVQMHAHKRADLGLILIYMHSEISNSQTFLLGLLLL